MRCRVLPATSCWNMNKSNDTCQCGVRYDWSSDADIAWHDRWHDEFARGPVLGAPISDEPIGCLGAFAVYELREDASKTLLDASVNAAKVLAREKGLPSGHDGSVVTGRSLYLLVGTGRVAGMIILDEDSFAWRLAFDGGKFRLLDVSPVQCRISKVSRIWIAADCRRRRLGLAFLKLVLAHNYVQPDAVGWEMPLTVEGTELVRALCANEFLACGDGDTIAECTSG